VMRISQVGLERTQQVDELAGNIDDYRLWYRFAPGTAPSAASSDPFLAAALLAAMARGESLEVDPGLAVSPRLLAALEQIQQIFATWLGPLQHVAVSASTAPSPAPAGGVGCFFSGGVDSLYTYLRHEAEITHLVQIHGYDYRRQNRSLAEQVEQANRRFAEARGKKLLVIESNFRELFEKHRLHINVYHGAILASVALASGLGKVYVPSSGTWSELGPWGSHAVTDPLWSSESVAIVHDGLEARRVDKLRRIGGDRQALDLLRVCPRNSSYSCGVCEKCLRTRVCLRVLGLRSPNLAPLDSIGRIYRLSIGTDSERRMWAENLQAAEEAGDRALVRAIALVVARRDLRRALRSLDRALLGGSVRRSAQWLKGALARQPPEPAVLRIDLDS
jgi:hypothetical protein